jgi:hypothetical protein
MKVAIIFVGATPKQNEWWWPSYYKNEAGIKHDIILVHRNMEGVPETLPDNVILENKILPTGEIPDKAFGAYRYFFTKYQHNYDYFAFVSDDVYLRRKNWLKQAVEMFEKYPLLGAISPMLHNNPAHLRAPIWFGRSEAFRKVNWNFMDDHDGEMTIADKCVAAGYFVAQIGHKFDFAYDPEWDGNANPRVCGAPQPNQWLEKIFFGEHHFEKNFIEEEIQSLEKYKTQLFEQEDELIADYRIRPVLETQQWSMLYEIQPYHGLIYNRSLHIVKEAGYEFDLFDKTVNSGNLDPKNNTFFGPNNGRYYCGGVNEFNPIAILK